MSVAGVVLVTWLVIGATATTFAALEWPHRHYRGGMIRLSYFILSALASLAMVAWSLVVIA